jgi:hypothetical protein
VAPDFDAVEAALVAWLCARPDAAVAYARATAASASFPSGLAAALQRRSSLQFLLEWFPRLMSRSSASCHAAAAAAAAAAGPLPLLCPSVAARLRAEAREIDGALAAALAAAGGGGGGRLGAAVPAGLPRSHAWWWWWASSPPPASSSCADQERSARGGGPAMLALVPSRGVGR